MPRRAVRPGLILLAPVICFDNGVTTQKPQPVSRRALLNALNDYGGAVILIVHDLSLMEMVPDQLWLAADNTVTPFDGDMDDSPAPCWNGDGGRAGPGGEGKRKRAV